MQSARRRERQPSGRTNLQQAGTQSLDFSPIINTNSRQQQQQQNEQQATPFSHRSASLSQRNDPVDEPPGYVMQQSATNGRGNTGRSEISSLYTSPSKSIFGNTRNNKAPNNMNRTNRTKRSMFEADRDLVSLTNEPKKIRQVARALDRSEFEDVAMITERSVEVAKHVSVSLGSYSRAGPFPPPFSLLFFIYCDESLRDRVLSKRSAQGNKKATNFQNT